MSIPIEFDLRYKVNDKIISRMKELRKQGLSYRLISERFGFSSHTAYYWLNKRYRKHKRELNAKRICDTDKRIMNRIKQDKLFTEKYVLCYIAKELNSCKYNKKSKTILGIPQKHWEDYLVIKGFYSGMIKVCEEE